MRVTSQKKAYICSVPLSERGYDIESTTEIIAKTTEAMGIIRSLFHCNTQITLLEKGDYTVCMEYNHQISKIARNSSGNGFLWSLFHYQFFCVNCSVASAARDERARKPPIRIEVSKFGDNRRCALVYGRDGIGG